jgi:hypothetical protein
MTVFKGLLCLLPILLVGCGEVQMPDGTWTMNKQAAKAAFEQQAGEARYRAAEAAQNLAAARYAKQEAAKHAGEQTLREKLHVWTDSYTVNDVYGGHIVVCDHWFVAANMIRTECHQ